MRSVVVIGAGIGGLAAATRLAREGWQVTVVEKNAIPGGRCGSLDINGHHFDTGATLLLMPDVYRQAFRDLGTRLEDHLVLQRVDPAYHVHFADGLHLALTSDLAVMRQQLEVIEPGSFNAFLRYLAEGGRHYHLALPHLVQRDFRNLASFLTPRNLLLFLQLHTLSRHYDRAGHYFKDPRLKIAFTFQNLYMGLSPYRAPAIYSLIPFSEFADGIWYPQGGMYRVVEALATIAERWGVRFLYNSPVARIDVEGRRATGVTLVSGESLEADVVLANADLAYVYQALLPDRAPAQRLAKKKFGCSALVFLWGLDRQYPQLAAHNLFFAPQLQGSFAPLFDGRGLPDEPHFYVHAPARLDASIAPPGGDSLYIGLPAGHMREDASLDWEGIRKCARRAVLRRLQAFGLHDLERHITVERWFTPPDWQESLNLVRGATHGLSHDLTQMGYLRPHSRHARYRNLYFVGASTHPGTGIPCVLVSARLVTDRILQECGVGSVLVHPRRVVSSEADPLPRMDYRTPLQEKGERYER